MRTHSIVALACAATLAAACEKAASDKSRGEVPPVEAANAPAAAPAAAAAGAAPAAAPTHRDGGAAPTCRPATGRIQVSMPAGYTAKDVAEWYLAATCNTVVVPKYTRLQRAEKAIATTVDAAELDRVFREMLAGLGLAAVTQGGIAVLFDNREHVVENAPHGPRIYYVPFSARPVAPAPRDPEELRARMESGIRKLGDNHYQIDRELIVWLIAEPSSVSTSARIVPSIHNGKPAGFKLFAIRPKSLYARCGFENGDVVKAVNGHDVFTPDQALAAFVEIEDAPRIEIDLTRRGKPLRLTIDVK